MLVAPGPLHHHRVRLIGAGDKFYEKHGPKTVFLGRWIALVRVAAAWLAGINRMPFKEFFMWNALGGITWGVTVGLIAYALGDAAAKIISQAGLGAAIAIGIVVLAILGYRRWRERRRSQSSADAP